MALGGCFRHSLLNRTSKGFHQTVISYMEINAVLSVNTRRLGSIASLSERRTSPPGLKQSSPFPQDLLPCHFTTVPLQRDALTLVLRANKGGIITHELIEGSIVDSLWTFRYGEALADAIVAYGSVSIFQQE